MNNDSVGEKEKNLKNLKVNEPIVIPREMNNKRIKKISFRCPKGVAKKASEKSQKQRREEKRTERNRRTKIKGAIAGGLALLTIAGITANVVYDNNKPIGNVRQAMECGETLTSLGIDSNVIFQTEEIKRILADKNISDKDLKEISLKIRSLQFDAIKTKLSNLLGVNKEGISLQSNYTKYKNGGSTESVQLSDGRIYEEKDFSTNKNTISSDIASYIIDIGEIKDLIIKLQDGNIERKELIKEYEKHLKKIEIFEDAKLVEDENGNISLVYITKED